MRNSLARRVLWVHVILLLALCGVLLRIFVIGQGEQYRQTAAAQSRYTLSAGTARGNIYDCRLRPLVNESEKTVLAVDPTPAAMTALRQGLSAEQFEEIYPLLQSGRPVLLPSDFSISGEGITALRVPQRYSADQLAPHIIGYINGEGRGICGIESGYEEQLTRWGGEITVRYTVNAWRQATGQAPEVTDPTDHTAGIVLTLDKDLQTIVEREGAVLGRGAVVLLEAETGAIRAMASFPGYDVTDVAAALEAADSPLLNRATAAWNVGSIFKVCVAAAALENEVELPENYCCEGFYRLGDHSYFCHERAGHGTLDLQQAMQLSCNPYFVELGPVPRPCCGWPSGWALGPGANWRRASILPPGRFPHWRRPLPGNSPTSRLARAGSPPPRYRSLGCWLPWPMAAMRCSPPFSRAGALTAKSCKVIPSVSPSG